MDKKLQLIDTTASTDDTLSDSVADGPPAKVGEASVNEEWEQPTIGRFQLLHRLGKGGMGTVFAAYDPQLQREVAIKRLHATGAKEQQQMMREARGLASLSHPNVITIYDVGVDKSGSPYLVMELLEGRDLSTLLRGVGALPVVEAVGLLLQACDALSAVHPLGVVHRDLKPANLFLTENSDGTTVLRVIDFGISKLVENAPTGQASTATGAVFGTPAYMSPEQIRSSKNVDARSDIWSLGIILHEMLAGSLPFKADSLSGQLACILTEEPKPLRKTLPNASKALEDVLLACLDRDREKRPQNVGQLARLLLPHAPVGAETTVQRIELAADLGAIDRTRPKQNERSHGAQQRRQRRQWIATLIIAGAAAVAGTLLVGNLLKPSTLREANQQSGAGTPPPVSPSSETDKKSSSAQGLAAASTGKGSRAVDGQPQSAAVTPVVDAGPPVPPDGASPDSAPTQRPSVRTKPRRRKGRVDRPEKRSTPDAGLRSILDTRK